MLCRPDLVLGHVTELASLVLLHLLLGGLQLCGGGQEVEGAGGDEVVLGPAPVGALVIPRTIQVNLGGQEGHPSQWRPESRDNLSQ